jgi:prepilin-type N-terminal cleavage/methylation domain-containing protein
MRRQSGFTMVELVIVILILGVLAATAMPKFLDVRDDAKAAAVDGTLGGISSALTVAKTAYMTGKWSDLGLPVDSNGDANPDDLGDYGDPTSQRTFFDAVLDVPIENADYNGNGSGRVGWKSANGWLPNGGRYYYYYDGDGDNQFDAAKDSRFYYDAATGRITQDYFGAD